VLAAGFYPTPALPSGVAWMLGIGRFGRIVGSFLVAPEHLAAQREAHDHGEEVLGH